MYYSVVLCNECIVTCHIVCAGQARYFFPSLVTVDFVFGVVLVVIVIVPLIEHQAGTPLGFLS